MEKTKKGIDEVIQSVESMWGGIRPVVMNQKDLVELEEKRNKLLKLAKDLKLIFDTELSSTKKNPCMEDYKTLLADAKEISGMLDAASYQNILQGCVKAYLAAKTGELIKDE